MYLGNELCRTFNIIKTDKDIILSALALHDTMKRGLKETDHKTYHLYHPYYPRLHYKKYRIKGFEVEYDKIMDCIESHMGSLNPDDHWGIISKAKPTNMPEAIVHLADYIASRDKIYFKDFM